MSIVLVLVVMLVLVFGLVFVLMLPSMSMIVFVVVLVFVFVVVLCRRATCDVRPTHLLRFYLPLVQVVDASVVAEAELEPHVVSAEQATSLSIHRTRARPRRMAMPGACTSWARPTTTHPVPRGRSRWMRRWA